MKKILLSAIAIFAMTLCSFAQMTVCEDACAPHANAADYTNGIIPTYPTEFPTLTVGQQVDQCVSIQIPSSLDGGAISAIATGMTVALESVTVNELVNLPTGLTACASANPMNANQTYTLRITGAPEAAGSYELKLKVELAGEVSGGLFPVQISTLNSAINTLGGVSSGIIINVIADENAPVADFTTDPVAGPDYLSLDFENKVRISAGQTVTYTNTSTNATSVNWNFEGGSPATSTEASAAVVVTYAAAGEYTTTLTAHNGDLTTTKTVAVVVSEAEEPIVIDFEADHTTVYVGQEVHFTNHTTGASYYLWTFDADNSSIIGGLTGGTSTDENPTYTYSAAGVYSVKLAASNSQYGVYLAADSLVKTDYITVIEDPNAVVANFTTSPEPTNLYIMQVVTINEGEAVTYTSACSQGTHHVKWSFEGGNPATSTQNEVTVTYTTAGENYYTTTLVAYNEDETVTDTASIMVLVSPVETSVEESAISAVSVYPNPANDMFTVANAEGSTIVVVNALGQVVANIENAAANQTIDASNFANGTYFVKVNAEVIKINVVK